MSEWVRDVLWLLWLPVQAAIWIAVVVAITLTAPVWMPIDFLLSQRE